MYVFEGEKKARPILAETTDTFTFFFLHNCNVELKSYNVLKSQTPNEKQSLIFSKAALNLLK